MAFIGMILYIANILFCAFSFNQAITEQQKQLIVNGIIFLTIAITSVALYMPDYLIESIIMSVIGGASIVFTPGRTPDFLFRKVWLFNIICVGAIGLFAIVFIIS